MKILFLFCAIVISVDVVVCITIHLQCKTFYQKRKDIEARLTASLKNICAQLNVPITYHQELGSAAGKILYHSCNGKLTVETAQIQILNKYANEPYVLAHELGHYFSIKSKQDRSECGADNEALCLCKSILTQEEQKLMSSSLQCYFGH